MGEFQEDNNQQIKSKLSTIGWLSGLLNDHFIDEENQDEISKEQAN